MHIRSRHHLLALTRAGRIYGWGDNRMGQLGLGHAVTSVRGMRVTHLYECM